MEFSDYDQRIDSLLLFSDHMVMLNYLLSGCNLYRYKPLGAALLLSLLNPKFYITTNVLILDLRALRSNSESYGHSRMMLRRTVADLRTASLGVLVLRLLVHQGNTRVMYT